MGDIYVIDQRPGNDASLNVVPRLFQFGDIVTHFADVTIDQQHGWDVTPSGQACWKLVGFHVTFGPVVLSAKVLDQNGQYLAEKWVQWHYTGLPPGIAGDGSPPYCPKALAARTKAEGTGAEFVVTADHFVAPGHAGPDSIWVAVEAGGLQYSDAVHGLGMRVHTNHLIVNPIFQYVVKEETGPGGEPPAHDFHLAIVFNNKLRGRVTPGSATPGDTYLALYHQGQEIGRIRLSQDQPGKNCLLLRDGATDLGQISW